MTSMRRATTTALLSQCTGDDYGPAVATTKRKTPQRTVGVDDELWEAAQRIAARRRERVSDVLRRALVDYVERHKDPARGDS